MKSPLQVQQGWFESVFFPAIHKDQKPNDQDQQYDRCLSQIEARPLFRVHQKGEV
jgi:hypothetical protein